MADPIRYVVTHVNEDGQRVMTFACQFRNTHPTEQSAQWNLDAIKKNNSPSVVSDITGGNPNSLEVRPVECWAMRDGSIGDPKTRYFD